MNRIPATSGCSPASTASAFGPCSAISPRSSGSTAQLAAEPGLEMREILRLAGRVHHQQQMVAAVRDHQVVEDAARHRR